jgi:hypothetical protein
MTVATKGINFWNLTTYYLVEVYWRFGRAHFLHLHGRQLSLACYQQEVKSYVLVPDFMLVFLFDHGAGASKFQAFRRL